MLYVFFTAFKIAFVRLSVTIHFDLELVFSVVLLFCSTTSVLPCGFSSAFLRRSSLTTFRIYRRTMVFSYTAVAFIIPFSPRPYAWR